MLVSVWRHGEAAPGSPDRERSLTERGQGDVTLGAGAFVAQLRARHLPPPGQILFSRWRRTTQTAERLGAALPGVPSASLEALIPGSDVVALDSALAELSAPDAHIVLVSHQPLVSELIDYWLGTRGEVPALTPGAFAVLTMPVPGPGCASLVWWASPPEYKV